MVARMFRRVRLLLALPPRDWLAGLRAGWGWRIRKLFPDRRPHFVRDYRHLADDLTFVYGRDQAMAMGVGSGDHAEIGRIEAAILQRHGLGAGSRVIDVGCGSGRLASALAKIEGIAYHGTDVVAAFIAHARAHAPAHFRFTLCDGLRIPDSDASAEFVTFFSVLTHLHQHESFIYLQDAVRVLKPGGRVVMTFLEISNPAHWPVFENIVANTRAERHQHLDQFFEVAVIETWASRLGLTVEEISHGGRPDAAFGQSIAVLCKPER
jgi:ubiquinone/menaquinone biosynthesis C-methylase UbiE